MIHRRSLLSAGAAALVLASAHDAARACGGFFCGQVPIDQSGEQIVFSLTDRGVAAHIQIQFQGRAEDFAWVVPVQSQPNIELGTQALFTTLLQRTQPRFQIDWETPCGGLRAAASPGAGGSGGASGAAAEDGVRVLEQREVGPYATVVLASGNADELVRWLDSNGYQQPPSALPLIEHYVKTGHLFVALKLKQDAGVGEIQPIVLEMPHAEACVPLILTRIAAVPDMPVVAFVLGKARAFPQNWFHVELNLKKVDWFGGGRNYRQVLTQAIDEAAGRGFVTEFAGNTEFLRRALWWEGRYNLEVLRPLTDPVDFMNALLRLGLPRDQTIQSLLRKYIPMPQALRDRGVTEPQFYGNIAAYRSYLAGVRVDTNAFIAELEERVIKPLRRAQEMLDEQPYVTRLFATVSPDEMTRDPLFHFNPGLPPVSNVHRARGKGQCLSDGSMINVTLTFDNGEILHMPGPVRPFGGGGNWTAASAEPAAARIELVGPSGAPTQYTREQARMADALLDREPPQVVRSRTLDPASRDRGFLGCRAGGGGAPGAALVLALAALIGLRLRRRG